jgi:hypothetical protein
MSGDGGADEARRDGGTSAPWFEASMDRTRRRIVAGFTMLRGSGWTRSAHTRRVLLVGGLALFVTTAVVAVRRLPFSQLDPQPELLATACVVSLLGTFVNGAEYKLSAHLLGGSVGVRQSTRIAVLASAANLLPIPGAALVKMESLRRAGHGPRWAASVTLAIGLTWVGVAGMVAGGALLAAGDARLPALVALAVGFGALAVSLVLFSQRGFPGSAWRALLLTIPLEAVGVTLTAVRFLVVMRVVGFDATFPEAAAIAAAAIVATAAGVFPGGLGLGELLSAGVAAAIGMPASVGAVASALDRVVNLSVLALALLAVLLVGRLRAGGGAEPTNGDDSLMR